MITVTTKAAMRDHTAGARAAGRRIGLVPTMGAFHAGHHALMKAAREASGRRPDGHRHQRMQRDRLVRRQHVEAGGAGAVADKGTRPPRLDCRRGGGDLRVRHAQQHGARAARVRATAQGTRDPEGCGECGSEAASPDDGDGVQFPHGDTGFRRQTSG